MNDGALRQEAAAMLTTLLHARHRSAHIGGIYNGGDSEVDCALCEAGWDLIGRLRAAQEPDPPLARYPEDDWDPRDVPPELSFLDRLRAHLFVARMYSYSVRSWFHR